MQPSVELGVMKKKAVPRKESFLSVMISIAGIPKTNDLNYGIFTTQR
jgi:hypothetical protein